ncbi:hypothetical protein ACL02O_06970 [Micromonospora sp. MS34]|uniref:hypothetical protein n=1 Tax=Micromonospora sp. MS34 TaxID=3385971 RepID=UPI0039A3D383
MADANPRGLPTCVVLTFTDELTRRQGHLAVTGFPAALGAPAVPVLGHRGRGVDVPRDRLAGWRGGPVR